MNATNARYHYNAKPSFWERWMPYVGNGFWNSDHINAKLIYLAQDCGPSSKLVLVKQLWANVCFPVGSLIGRWFFAALVPGSVMSHLITKVLICVGYHIIKVGWEILQNGRCLNASVPLSTTLTATLIRFSESVHCTASVRVVKVYWFVWQNVWLTKTTDATGL